MAVATPQVQQSAAKEPVGAGIAMGTQPVMDRRTADSHLHAYLRVASPLFRGAALASALSHGTVWAIVLGAGLVALGGAAWDWELTHARSRNAAADSRWRSGVLREWNA